MKIGIIGQGFVGTAVKEGLKQFYEIDTFDLDESKRDVDYIEDIVDRKREFNKNFEDTETITQINVEKNDKKRSSFSSRATEQNEGSFEEKSKSVTQEETAFPQFSLNVSNPISWTLMLLIMVMQFLSNIMLVVVLYLK